MNNTWSLFFFKFQPLFYVQIPPSFYWYLLQRDRSDRHWCREAGTKQYLLNSKSAFLSENNNCSILPRTGEIQLSTNKTDPREQRKERKPQGFHWVLTGIQTFAGSSLKKFCIFSKCNVHSYLQMNSDCSFLPCNSS